jgi:hypothetical protein
MHKNIQAKPAPFSKTNLCLCPVASHRPGVQLGPRAWKDPHLVVHRGRVRRASDRRRVQADSADLQVAEGAGPDLDSVRLSGGSGSTERIELEAGGLDFEQARPARKVDLEAPSALDLRDQLGQR